MQKIFKPKLFSILKKGYSKDMLSRDLLAGIIVGIVALPLAIAFAVASGVSPERGLITAIIAGFIISAFGGSRVQIGGPTGAFIVIVLGIINSYGYQGLLISTIFAGILLIIFGVLRLGVVLKFIPYPLIVGFTSGIALIIFTTQIKDALGLEIEGLSSDFIPRWGAYFSHIEKTNIYSLVTTIATILFILFSQRIIRKIPGSFIAIILVTGAIHAFNIPVSTIGSIFGEIPSKIEFQSPHFEWTHLKEYFQPALTIALLGAIESLLSAVVADGMISGNHRSNTELIAQGIANVTVPFFGGIPATGAIARTATNVKNGGRTPIAGIIHALVLLLIMLFLGKWAVLIPMPCLAGILIFVAYNMSEWRNFASILKGSKYDVIILLTSFSLTVLVDLTVAIEVGVVLSALLFMQRMSKFSNIQNLEKDTDELESYEEIPKGIEIFEISGPFFFAAARKYQETIKKASKSSKAIIIRMRHVQFIDSTGISNLKDTVKELNHKKVKIILSGVNKEVRSELDKHRLSFLIGKGNIHDNFEEALRRAKEIITQNK